MLAHAQVLRVHAHDQLDERGQRQQEEDGGEGHVVREVDRGALLALELDLCKEGKEEKGIENVKKYPQINLLGG